MEPYLHESAQAEDGVIEAALLQVLLSAGFHLHERNLRMLVTVVDGEEHVSLNAHRLQHHDAPELICIPCLWRLSFGDRLSEVMCTGEA